MSDLDPISSERFDNTPYCIGGYEISIFLAAGTTAIIKLGRNLQTGHYYAIKIYDKKFVLTNPHLTMVGDDIAKLKNIRHPYIVHTYEVFANETKFYVVLEIITGGELFSSFPRNGIFTETEARRYFQHLICAVDYCHKRGVYHGNIKPENLLLDGTGNLKVSDFGLGILGHIHDNPLDSIIVARPEYMAPEAMTKTGFKSPMADIWSCGVILYVMIAGPLPFCDRDPGKLFFKACGAMYTMPEFFSPSLKNLIKRLLHPNPNTRITMEEIFKDEWFKKDFQAPTLLEEEVEPDPQDVPAKMNMCTPGFFINLVGNLLREAFAKRKSRFIVSDCSVKTIMSEIESAADCLGYKVKEGSYKLKFEKEQDGEIIDHISIATKISDTDPSDELPVRTVEIKKVGGTLEFDKFYDVLSTELRDIMCEVVTEEETDGASTSTARC